MAEALIVRGGKPLKGAVELSGAKNVALKVVCAALLADEPLILENVPVALKDVEIQLSMVRSTGARVDIRGNQVIVDPRSMNEWRVEAPGGRSTRASLLLLAPLLARFGRARVPAPGGDDIGDRKYDLHVYALQKLGARIWEERGYICANCGKLEGTVVDFPIRTTGGTENTMLAACLAASRTIICNAYTRPEVADLATCLNAMGARVRIAGSGLIEVEGVEALHGATHRVMPDPLEAFTFIIFAAVTRGRVKIAPSPASFLEVPMVYLRESGVRFRENEGTLEVCADDVFTCVDVATGVYPGVNTDMQPLFAAYATRAVGRSRIVETQFPERFRYVAELRKFGANIIVEGNAAIVQGEQALRGARATAPDIRGGAAVLALALAAEGESIIENAYQIDRGYERIEEKLRGVSALVQRVEVGYERTYR